MKPKRPLRPSAPDRHQLDRFGSRTFLKATTSTVLPGTELAVDLASINRGEGEYLGNHRWRINDRIYLDKGDGTTFPLSGEGVIRPSRLVLLALQILIRSGGDADDLHRRTHRHPDIDLNLPG